MARLQSDERKQETRHKIQLGGLVTKAGLAEEETAVLLGAFLTVAAELTSMEADVVRRRFRRLGDQAFKSELSQKLRAQ